VDLAVDLLPRDLVRLVVLKRLLPGYTKAQEERFLREARLSLRINHPVIAKTIDVEMVEGELGIVQEYVPGVNLSLMTSHAKGFQVKLELVLYIGSEIARALAYLHGFEEGILHRDVTPDNILLSYDGAIKLVDFGIAKELRPDVTALTAVGDFIGRPSYSAPEVLAGESPTPEADIYSLGVVLWQTLAGRPLSAIAGPVPPPSKFNAASDQILDALVLRCLSQRPRDRFSDATEVHLELQKLWPVGFNPERALASYLRAHFNVDANNQSLAEDVERVRLELVRARPKGAPARRRRALAIGVPAFLAGVALTAGVGAGVFRRPNAQEMLARRAELAPPRVEAAAPSEPSEPSSGTVPDMVQASQDPPKGIDRVPHPPPPEPALIPEPPKDDKLDDNNARARRPRRLAEGRKTPNVTDVQNQLGHAKSGGLLAEARARIVDGKFAEAREVASRALVAGGGGDAHLLLGIINQFQGRFVDAERELVQASGIEAQQHLVAVRKVLEDLKAEDQ